MIWSFVLDVGYSFLIDFQHALEIVLFGGG